MKFKIFTFIAATAALTACDNNDISGASAPSPTGEGQDNGTPVLFQSGSTVQTRANGTIINGKDAAGRLGGEFRVYGTKTIGAAVTVPFDNYVVEYDPDGMKPDDTEVSNQKGWEYMGKTSLGQNPVEQNVVYWDLSADRYDFAAFSGLDDNTRITGFDDISIDINTDNKRLVYASDKVTATKDGGTTGTTTNSKFREPIVLNFKCLTSRARIAIYETIPGYAVKDVRFYYGDNAGDKAATSTKKAAGLQGKFFTKATYTVTYDGNNKVNSGMSEKGTSEEKDYFTFGELDYTTARSSATTSDSYLKEDGTLAAEGDKVFLGTSATGATYAKVDGMDWQPILPYEDNQTKMKLRIDFTLVPLDGSQSTISVFGADVIIPLVYCRWKPNYAYTYLFRITDKTNGGTDPENPDNPGLYAITFDARVDETGDTIEDIFSNVEGKEDGSNEEHDTPDTDETPEP